MIWIILGKFAGHYVDSTLDMCPEGVSGYHLKKNHEVCTCSRVMVIVIVIKSKILVYHFLHMKPNIDLAFSHFSVKKNSSIQCRTVNGMGKYIFFQIIIVSSYI